MEVNATSHRKILFERPEKELPLEKEVDETDERAQHEIKPEGNNGNSLLI